MYDPATTALIRSAPSLEGLDRGALPDRLSEAFAKIAAARLRLRSDESVEDTELATLIREMRRLAFTNEALVSVSPDREDRAAAAFVAASAHLLCFNAERIWAPGARTSFLSVQSISADISAMLLFLVAEATADASEIARQVRRPTGNPVERALIAALRALAQGRLKAIVETARPEHETVRRGDAAETAASALYLELLEGVRSLAAVMLSSDVKMAAALDPASIFRRVQSLCIGFETIGEKARTMRSIGAFAGPYHLASLMIAVAGDLSASAVIAVAPPGGVDADKWRGSLKRIAETRPYLWRNHREAIGQQYLEPGSSAAVGFPTGAGKSILAELKINATLLSDRKVVFLAPTHALVDQTAQSLRQSFPTARVQYERFDEFGFMSGEEDLPEILLMTPEACLTQMSVDVSVFEGVGLLVFDECHLLHPSDNPKDRRAIDAMLCVLNFAQLFPDADLLLLSAMMKNTDEVAAWIEATTGRRCLALSLAWKPTRQLRGSIVYEQDRVAALNTGLAKARAASTIKGVPATAKRMVGAQPLCLFSLKQTWATRDSADYALLPLLDDEPLLGIGQAKRGRWYLTPNAGELSSALAAAAAEHGMKTLIFFQTITNARSAAEKVDKRLGAAAIPLKEDEKKWLDSATLELGGAAHLYVDVKDGKLRSHASVHHGLLLPEERRLCESLYKRPDGISVLTATSTLAQGMNLPSELVIIAEDSRFDEIESKREVLEAHELLNAAGRAGRAGQNANGIVLVVPGKVVGIDFEEKTIDAHWTTLQVIFGQSDQCLDIDDPLTALLDRVHANADDLGEVERYAIGRLASCGYEDDSSARLSRAISASLGGFRARRDNKEGWLQSRIEAAVRYHQAQTPETEAEVAEQQIAATLGMPVDVVTRLAGAIAETPPQAGAHVPVWRLWFFDWLTDNPDLVERVFRKQSLDELFGKTFENIEDAEERAAYAVPYLKTLTRLWMSGKPLCNLEAALGTDLKKLKTCTKARRFVLRIVPELAYLFGLPALLYQRKEAVDSESTSLSPALLQLGRCARLGFNTHEKAALNDLLRAARFSRRQLHQHFALIKPYVSPAPDNETWDQTLDRIETALEIELDNRT